jgi:predicted unusual protein kinase regulating ubiquinone biosynthesis (AarF/ABC1/UbiB family)
LLKPRNIARLQHVVAVFARHGFEDVLDQLDLLSRVGLKRRRPRKPAERLQARAEKLRVALEELGTTYIKLGQLLSTRPDLLPGIVAEELARLQDRVEPVAFEEMKPTLEAELKRSVEEVFEGFDTQPVASASIAQVYRARLRAGVSTLEGDVAVKVVKPGVPELVEADMEILREAAERLSRSALGRRYDFKGLAAQLETTLFAELDLAREAQSARRLSASLTEYPRLRVPKVAEDLTSRRVLVLEYVDGTKLAAFDGRSPELADELWRAYLKQILVDGAFQCDPHPGNFLVDSTGRLVMLDFGMIAFVSRENQLRLMALLVALVERDGERAARICLEMGVAGPEFREGRFRAAVGLLVARHAGVTLRELSFGLVVRDLLVLCLRHDVQIPPELALLGKTLLNLEPMCRRLDPDLDPVRTMKEVAARLLEEQVRRELTAEKLMSVLLELRAFVQEVPLGTRRLLTRMASNELRVGIKIEKAEQMQLAIRDVANRVTLGVITAALILASAFLLSVDAGLKVFGYPLFSLVGFLLAAGLGIYVVAQILLGRR